MPDIMDTVGRRLGTSFAGTVLLAVSGAAQGLSLELAAVAESFEYEEPGLMRETGELYGVEAALDAAEAPGWGFELRGRYLGGELHYDGQTQAGTPVETDTDDDLTQVAGHIGYTARDQGVDAFLYTGYGNRYWDQTLNGPGGYQREIEWHYLPVGARMDGDLGARGWSWALRVEYRELLDGDVTSRLSDVDPGLNDLRNNVDSGHGYRLAFRVERDLGGYALTVTPYYTYWDVEASDLQPVTFNGVLIGSGYEPANETEVVGVTAGLRF